MLRWVKDKRRAIVEGVKFQRLRGTPASLKIALKWANIEDITIIEEPPGKHFFELQIGIRDVPNNFFVDAVVELAKLSLPARSRLMRIFNDHYNVDRFILDESLFGSLLSDYSGIKVEKNGPVLSFGRVNFFRFSGESIKVIESYLRNHYEQAFSNDIYRLDVAVLGETETHTKDYKGIYERDRLWYNLKALYPLPQSLLPEIKFAKAQIVLSDSWNLGEINACFAQQVNIRNLSDARKANFVRYEMSFSKSKFFKEVSSKNINKRNEEGETILHQAVEISDYKTVRLLIKKGAEVNARDKNGYTPLHCAVFAKSLENVKVLLRSGAEVNATQYITGCTPLHSACKMGGAGVEIIKELVKAGAEVNQLNKYGATPMYYIWESEKYRLCDSKESEKASKFLREKGGITKSRELTCYGIEGLVGEIADMLNGSYMPELKIIEIGEIRKRDRSLIKKECQNLASKIMSQVNEMIDEVAKRGI
ncbi:hypothetical protein J6590_079702 [Homalodisca vitripennis]|nr:hypothetical protein J6590_079702 [Homalodisca vitripennis]